jgi:hypothetical protein
VEQLPGGEAISGRQWVLQNYISSLGSYCESVAGTQGTITEEIPDPGASVEEGLQSIRGANDYSEDDETDEKTAEIPEQHSQTETWLEITPMHSGANARRATEVKVFDVDSATETFVFSP